MSLLLCIFEALKYLNAAFNCQKNKYYLLLDIPISFCYDKLGLNFTYHEFQYLGMALLRDCDW